MFKSLGLILLVIGFISAYPVTSVFEEDDVDPCLTNKCFYSFKNVITELDDTFAQIDVYSPGKQLRVFKVILELLETLQAPYVYHLKDIQFKTNDGVEAAHFKILKILKKETSFLGDYHMFLQEIKKCMEKVREYVNWIDEHSTEIQSEVKLNSTVQDYISVIKYLMYKNDYMAVKTLEIVDLIQKELIVIETNPQSETTSASEE